MSTIDYSKIMSKRVQDLKPSGIRRFFDIAAEMEGVISLGVGEPDFKTPWAVRAKAIETLEKGKTIYTANAGMQQLRDEIAKYMERKYRVKFDAKTEVTVTVGGSEAIDMCIRTMISEGDEVIVVEPCFVAYAPIVELTGGKVVPVVTRVEDKFRLTAKSLREKITDKTKMIILPFPNNPTGAVMRREHLEEIADVLRGTDIIKIGRAHV